MKNVQFADGEFKTSARCYRIPYCVEVAHKDGVVAVRNSQDPEKKTAYFTTEEWAIFTAGVKDGEFNFA